jgi:hypothetical protein
MNAKQFYSGRLLRSYVVSMYIFKITTKRLSFMCPSKDISLSQHIAVPYIASNTVLAFLWFVVRKICEKIYSKIIVGESHYSLGKRYRRRCECYFITKRLFCECCGMQLRVTPSEREYKEKMRENLVTINKKKAASRTTELRDQFTTWRQTFYAWDKPLVT